MELGRDLAAIATRQVSDLANPSVAFEQLAQSLPRVRHVEFELTPSNETAPRGTRRKIRSVQAFPASWLAQALSPSPEEQWFPVMVQGKAVGELRLRSNSADEIAEIAGEIELFSAALALLCLFIVSTLLWAVRRSLRSIELLAEGFDRLERRDYRPIPPIPIRELRRVGEQFNHLARSLGRVTADNHFLVGKLLSVQEQERKEMAAELHDEFGPALFGIRAEATCIMRYVSEDEQLRRIRTHARAISDLTDGIQKVNSRMLDRLRPLVLEQMGLHQAMIQLVTSWQARYPQMKWCLDVPDDFCEPPEESALALYRVVQEAVTNAIRHAQASAIEISLERRVSYEGEPNLGVSAADSVCLSVRDNGMGLPENLQYGFGLLGMTERVRRLGGTLKITNARPTGVVVQALVPIEVQTVQREHADANPAD
jgi:two-component system sensor histidine kinase UhpB